MILYPNPSYLQYFGVYLKSTTSKLSDDYTFIVEKADLKLLFHYH